MPDIGHNSGDDIFDVSADQLTDADSEQNLRQFFERVANLEEEKKGIADDIKDVWNEAKASGFDTKIARQVFRLWQMRPEDRREMEELLDTYKAALGLD